MKKLTTLSLAGTLALAAGSLPTYAGTVTAHLDSVTPRATVDLNFANHGWENSAYVGRIAWTPVSNTSGVATFDSPFYSFCIEGTQDVYIGQNSTFNVSTDIASAPIPGVGMGQTNADLVTKFWSLFFDQTGNDATSAAAFQLGIWELRYDGLSGQNTGFFADGDFKARNNTAVMAQATTWLSQVETATPTKSYDFYVLTSGGLQDQLVDDARPASVPLPAALPMGLALLGGLGVSRKIKRRA